MRIELIIVLGAIVVSTIIGIYPASLLMIVLVVSYTAVSERGAWQQRAEPQRWSFYGATIFIGLAVAVHGDVAAFAYRVEFNPLPAVLALADGVPDSLLGGVPAYDKYSRTLELAGFDSRIPLLKGIYVFSLIVMFGLTILFFMLKRYDVGRMIVSRRAKRRADPRLRIFKYLLLFGTPAVFVITWAEGIRGADLSVSPIGEFQTSDGFRFRYGKFGLEIAANYVTFTMMCLYVAAVSRGTRHATKRQKLGE